ncbi:MAG: diacylglycerol kinase family protein [Pseudomonadota bacterium]
MTTPPDAPHIPTGPLLILINAGSGRNNTEEMRQTIAEILSQADRSHRIVLITDPKKLERIARDAVAEALANDGAVVIAGGDGTINTIANAALPSGCPIGILPQGTFNYFGRAHGIPENIGDATRALLQSCVQPVQVGLVNERLFVVNASLGLYPKLLQDREAYTHQYGRSRLVATWAGLLTVMRWKRPMRLMLEGNGVPVTLKTFTLFVGNNRLQMEQLGIPLGAAVEDGQLAVVALRPVATLGMFWLVLRGAFNKLGDAENIVSFGLEKMKVKLAHLSPRRRIKVATDGEIAWLRAPLTFQVSPKPLYLLKPPATAALETFTSTSTT